jgi:hypothetical protein
MSVLPGGFHASAKERKRARTASGERERWAVGRFWFHAESFPAALFPFLFCFSFSFLL